MFQGQFPVVSNSEVMPGAYLMWLEAPAIAASASPGQFVMVRCGESHDPLLRRPFSIHRWDGDYLALLFSVVGRGTEWLAHRREGDSLDLLGPLGHGFEIHPDSRELLLIGGGIGVAPLLPLAEQALARGHSVNLLLGARSAPLVYPGDMLPSPLTVAIATEDGSAGTRGLVTDLIPAFLDRADQVFACGPLSMYRALATTHVLGDKPCQIILEERMGCGMGACYGCAIPTAKGTRLVCRDGPVFRLAEVLWGKLADFT